MIPQIDSGKNWYSNFQYLPRLNQNNLRNKNIVKGLYFIDSPRQFKNTLNIPNNMKIGSIYEQQLKESQIDNIYSFRPFINSTPKQIRNPAFLNQQKFNQNYNKYMKEVSDQMGQLIQQQTVISQELKKDNQVIVKQINFENLMDINN